MENPQAALIVMITLGVSYDINWGKSYKARNKRLNNSDNIDGIVK